MKTGLFVTFIFFLFGYANGQEEPDTTRIQLKEKLILIIKNEKDTDTIDAEPDKQTLKKVEAHWAGIEFGPTILLNSAMKSSFPNDKQWENDAAFQEWLAFMKKYRPEADLRLGSHVYAYSSARLMVDILRASGDTLTRENVLKQAGMNAADIDLWEINEAFAVVTMAAMHEMKLPHDKVNVNGGACALGHPIGASGARILVTLIGALRKRGLKRGVASLCIGGGEATAMAIELV